MDILWAWGEALLRWLHVIAAAGWIGSSFYFVHLDLSLRQRTGLPPDAHGDTWQVHGGGFYHMIKYLVAPAKMPVSTNGMRTAQPFLEQQVKKEK